MAIGFDGTDDGLYIDTAVIADAPCTFSCWCYTAKRAQRASITCTNDDSMAADDYIAIRISRDANNASDDLPEDAWLWGVKFEYTTT